jgi:lysophospholipase L1-like esterase
MSALSILFFSIWICNSSNSVNAQNSPYDIDQYEFIKYDENILLNTLNDPAYEKLFEKFNQLILTGQGQINILHIGDSHIQADIISGRMRERLQTFFKGGIGGRGFIFPCSIAGTNNPVNIIVDYKGKWSNCKNIRMNDDCIIGLSGFSITTEDPNSVINIKSASWEFTHYDFTRIKIFHSFGDTSFIVDIGEYYEEKEIIENERLGYTEFILQYPIDTLLIQFFQKDSAQNSISIYGISLENDEQGVLYHAVGVNGAKASSFLKCDLLEEHIEALNPDWVIVSLGTNDVYSTYFDKKIYALEMNRLIRLSKEASPNAAYLITTPGDNFRYGTTPNKNTKIAQEIIFKLGKHQQCAVWDFYEIMGGFKSMEKWEAVDLCAKDKVHFSKKGYKLQGDLLFNAFLKSYDQYIENKYNTEDNKTVKE